MVIKGPNLRKYNANLINDRKKTSEHFKLKWCILLLVVGFSLTLSSCQVSGRSYKSKDKISHIQTVEHVLQI